MKLCKVFFRDYKINNGIGWYKSVEIRVDDESAWLNFRPGYDHGHKTQDVSSGAHVMQFISEDANADITDRYFLFAHLSDEFFKTVGSADFESYRTKLKERIETCEYISLMYGLGYSDIVLIANDVKELTTVYQALKKFISSAQIVAPFSKNDFLKSQLNELQYSIIAETTYVSKELKENDPEVFYAYDAFRNNYTTYLIKQNYAHKRALVGVKDMLALYNTAIDNRHRKAIKDTVGGFLTSFFTCAAALIDYMHKSEKHFICNCAGERLDNKTYVNFIEEITEEVKTAVSNLLCGILKSDSNRWDDLIVPRTSIGGTVKLVLAYNKLLCDWENEYIKWENKTKSNETKPNETDFAYLVTSGGKDITVHKDIFDHNHDALVKYRWDGKTLSNTGQTGKILKRPILVEMPECSLYFSHTSLRLAHEFFHKRGNRKRKDRYAAMFNSLNAVPTFMIPYRIGAQYLKTYLYIEYENNYHRKDWRWQEDDGQEDDGKNKHSGYGYWQTLLLDYDDPVFCQLRKDIGEKFRDAIYRAEDLLERDYKWVDDIDVGDVAIEPQTAPDLFLQETYEDCKTRYKKAFEDNMYRNTEKIADLLLKSIENVPKDIFNVDKELLCIDWRAKFANIEYCENVWNVFYDSIKSSELKKIDRLLGEECFNRAFAFDESLTHWFRECYADCMALCATGLDPDPKNKLTRDEQKESFLDYLFTCLYEIRDPKTCFYNPDYFSVRLDIPRQIFWCDLKDEDFYDDYIKEEITKWYKAINKDVEIYEAQNYADKVIDTIEHLIRLGEFYRPFIRLLKQYVESCLIEQKELFGLMQKTDKSSTEIEFVFNKFLSIFNGG